MVEPVTVCTLSVLGVLCVLSLINTAMGGVSCHRQCKEEKKHAKREKRAAQPQYIVTPNSPHYLAVLSWVSGTARPKQEIATAFAKPGTSECMTFCLPACRTPIHFYVREGKASTQGGAHVTYYDHTKQLLFEFDNASTKTLFKLFLQTLF